VSRASQRAGRPGFLLLTAALLAFGQQGGQITGVITDPAGAAIPNAQVEATNVNTGAVRVVETNASGTYVLSPLPVGEYTLRIEKSGFKTLTKPGIIININSALTLNLSMELGSAQQQVTVSGAAPIIDTETQELGNYRFEQQIQNLPIIVREVQTLVGQTAGVPYGSTDTVGGTFQNGSRSAMQVVADGGQLNPFQTTGYPAIDGIGRRADLTMPNIDTIGEFKLVTNGGDAQYAAPTAIIVATKSGTNELHGSLYEFYQSGGLSTRRWELPQPPSFVRHQFGGSAGGPITKDRMFFFIAAEAFSHVLMDVQFARYPTAAERSGDLSDLLQRTAANGTPAPVTLYDPLSGQPFPGNVIPANRIDPVSTELLKMIPPAPLPAGNLANFNSIFRKPLSDKSQKYDARWDYNRNERNQLFVRSTIGHIDQASRYSGSVPGPYGFTTKNYYTQSITGNWTRLLGPTALFKIQVSYRNEPFKNIPSGGSQVFSISIQGITAEPPFAGPPAIANGPGGLGISNLFDRLLFNFSEDHDYQINPTFAKTLGNHNLHAGFAFLHGIKTQELASPPYGRYTTASDFNNSKSTVSATGDAFADFLLGYPSSTDVTTGPHGGFLQKTNWSLFVQDDWKITSRFTLNLGLRYDNFGLFESTDRRIANGVFALGKVVIPDGSQSLIQPAFQQFSSLFVQASAAGLTNALAVPNNRDFSPRVGFAYQFGPQLVIRGGAGIYNNDITFNAFSNELNSPPFTYRAQLSRSLLISNGVDVNRFYTFENPTANGSTAAAANALSAIGGFTPNYPTQKAYEWNLTVERQIGGSMAIRASYLGNLGRNLARLVASNACVPGPVSCDSRKAGDPTARQWPQFSSTFGQNTEGGNSNFNSGEIEFSRRFSQGLLFDVNYSYSRLFGYQYQATNPVISALWRYDYGPISAQPYSVFHWNYVYELPFGRGRRFGNHISKWVDAVAGGWALSGLGTWQSGSPLTVMAGVGQSPTGAAANRADRIGNGAIDHGGSRGQNARQWFDIAAYRLPPYIDASAANPTRQFGSAGIGTVIGPRFMNYDASLQKRFQIRERARIELRIDAFDPFNVPMLDAPDLNVSSSTFGQIRTSNPNYIPRTFQFGARLDF